MPLGPDIQAFIQKMEVNRGFELKWLNRGVAFKLITKHSTYTAIVANAEEGELLLYCPESEEKAFHKPTIYALQGSTAGGSIVQVGWVGIGSRLRFNMLEGGVILLSMLKDIQFLESSAEINQLLAKAEADKPREATPEEVEAMRAKAEEWFKETFAGPHFDEVLKLIHEFCFPNGQMVIAALLDIAQRRGKLPEAIARVKKDFDEHWSFRPKRVRGEFITQIDAGYLDAAYRDLELPKPDEE